MNPQTNMKKYLRYLTNITRLSFLRMLSYRGDMLTFLIFLPIFFTLEILSVVFVFYAGNLSHILGYSVYEVLFVSTLGVWIYQICGMGTLVNDDIEQSIITGQVDMYLTKPISTTFQLCFRIIYTEGFFILLERGAALFIISYLGSLHFSFIQLLELFFVVCTSVIIQVSLLLIAGSMSLYFPRSSGTLQEYLLTLIQATQEFPKEIYPLWFQKIGISLMPIFLITNPTFQILHHTYTISYALYTLLIMFLCIMVAWWSWTKGWYLYESAN